MGKQLINPSSLYDTAPLGMSQAVIDTSTSLVFVSGQLDWDLEHRVSSLSIVGQFESAIDKLRIALDAAGATVDNVLHLRIYVRGEVEDHMTALGPSLARFLGDSRPAVTGIGVASLASRDALVEVEAIARAG
jgi:2-iminobutanoate/2-iminopropanoate deaminase